MSYPMEYQDYYKVVMEDMMIEQWFIPAMLRSIEERINEMINKIFQENPSLP